MIFLLFQLFTALLIYVLPLKKRSKIQYNSMICILIVTFALIMKTGNNNKINMYLSNEFSNYIVIFLLLLLMMFSVKLYCEVSLIEAAYCSACAYITEHIVYCLRILINNISGKSFLDPGKSFYFLIYTAIYMLTYKFFVKQMVVDEHYTSNATNSIFILVSTVFMVAVMSITSSKYNFKVIHAIYALFSCFFVLYSQVKQQKHINAKKELDIQKQIWIKHKTQYEISRENIDIINKKCHDLKYQISALRKISSMEEQEEAIQSIEESVMIYDSIVQTGNDILDTILTEKGLICSERNISLTSIADGKSLEFMTNSDIFILFGNMLDNAIEGALKVENEEERFISLYIQKKLNLLLIQIENKYDGHIEMKNGMPITQKKDKEYHGFGVKSIFDIAEKYNGFATIDVNDYVFVLRITIPLS